MPGGWIRRDIVDGWLVIHNLLNVVHLVAFDSVKCPTGGFFSQYGEDLWIKCRCRILVLAGQAYLDEIESLRRIKTADPCFALRGPKGGYDDGRDQRIASYLCSRRCGV